MAGGQLTLYRIYNTVNERYGEPFLIDDKEYKSFCERLPNHFILEEVNDECQRRTRSATD
jgi:hypothetical protein